MKAVIINSTDILGGAGLAGYVICKALNIYTNFNTEILCGIKGGRDEYVTQILSGKSEYIYNILKRITISSISPEYFPPIYFSIINWVREKSPDVINLHNIHGNYFPYFMIRKLAKIAPIVVSMQDMWYITGHCTYAYDCKKWQTGCIHCNHKDWYEPILFSSSASSSWEKKQKLFQDEKITFVTCSAWMKNEAEKSLILRNQTVRHLYNPIETEIFKPIDRKVLKYTFNIPKDSNVLVFGAADIGDPRKGFKGFLLAITKSFVKRNNIFLLIMGEDRNGLLKHMPTYVPYRHIGPAGNSFLRACVYGAADLVIFPTLADNLSNIIIEALACGRSVVTFDTGGSGEVVKTNETGYLANYADYNDFQTGIELLLQAASLRKCMEQECRSFAVSNFSMEVCAKKYACLFGEVMN